MVGSNPGQAILTAGQAILTAGRVGSGRVGSVFKWLISIKEELVGLVVNLARLARKKPQFSKIGAKIHDLVSFLK